MSHLKYINIMLILKKNENKTALKIRNNEDDFI